MITKDIDKALVIITQTSIYRLSRPNETGQRIISCDNKILTFTTCKLIDLDVGEPLVLQILNGLSKGDGFNTSNISFIHEDITR